MRLDDSQIDAPSLSPLLIGVHYAVKREMSKRPASIRKVVARGCLNPPGNLYRERLEYYLSVPYKERCYQVSLTLYAIVTDIAARVECHRRYFGPRLGSKVVNPETWHTPGGGHHADITSYMLDAAGGGVRDRCEVDCREPDSLIVLTSFILEAFWTPTILFESAYATFMTRLRTYARTHVSLFHQGARSNLGGYLFRQK
jgi:hypothetical protein